MKKQNKYLIIVFVLMQLLLTSCIFGVGADGHDPVGIVFDSLSEFKETFAEFMAYPSYIPFEFDTAEGVTLHNSAITKIKYKNLPKEKYKRTDIFYDMRFGYYIENDKVNLKDNEFYKLTMFNYIFFPHNKLEQIAINEKLEIIEYNGYTVYYAAHLFSKIFYPDIKNSEDKNWILLNYHMEFDNKVYKFSFNYDIKPSTSKEKFFELRDKLKAETLPEVIKSYESLKYENKD